MKITIENTTKIVEVSVGVGRAVPCRVWEGETDSGIKVACLIPSIAVRNGQDTTQFDRELEQQRAPSGEGVMSSVTLVSRPDAGLKSSDCHVPS